MTWFNILKGGSLRLHFPSFKKAVLEWNETQQVGNEDRLDNMLKEIQPIYEELYFTQVTQLRRGGGGTGSVPIPESEVRDIWNSPRSTEPKWMQYKRRQVTMNANKKIPTAKGTLSNILHNNGWIKKMKHNTKTIDERWSYGYKPIGTMTESIGLYEKVK